MRPEPSSIKPLPLANRAELEKWVEGMADKMGESAICLSIFTDDYKKGIDSLLQFAVSIMLDKPILLLVPDCVKIPERVTRVADGIERYNEKDKGSFEAAAKRLLEGAQQQGFVA